MTITITYRQIIIGVLLLVLSYGSLAIESSNLIEDINFNRGKNGEGIVTISLPNQNVAPSITERQGKIIVNLPNTQLSELLQKEINVAESKTPIQTISPIFQNQTTMVNIIPIGNYNYSAAQLNNLFIITLWKRPEQPKASIDSNDNVFLNLPNTEIRTILKIIAEYKKMTLVMSESITGKMTLKMSNVPLEKALDIVLNANGLSKRVEEDVLIIAPTDFLCNCTVTPSEIKETVLKNSPLRRELFPIHYADAETIIEAFWQQQVKKGKFMEQERGNILTDKRTNTIIAYQTPEDLVLLNKIIKELDIPITQVRLETSIFEVNRDYVTIIKNQFNQGEPIDLLVNKMQKDGWGEVISQPKVTTSDKEQAHIMKGRETHCHFNQSCSSKPTLSFSITPEVINDSQLKLSIEIYMEPVEKKEKSSPVKKQIEKIVNNNQTIILDGLDDLGYPIKNDSQSKLMITITPKIVDHKSFSTR